MDLRRFQPSRRSVGAFAVGGAWFFIVVSLLCVVWGIVQLWGDPGTFKIYHTVVDEVSYDALWLTYTGVLGTVFAILQLLVVSGAAVTSALPFDRTLRARRASHLVLCSWSALWAINLIRLAAIDGQLDSVAQAAFLSVLFGCTVWRAAVGWTPRRTSTPDADPPAFEPVLADAPADLSAPDDADRESFSALVAVALNTLARFVRAAVQWVLGAVPRLRRGGRAARRRAAHGLHRVADFTHRQASRVAPNTGE